MTKEIWFAKTHTLRDGGFVLYCKPIPIEKETPKMWRLDAKDSGDYALAGYKHSVRKSENSFGYNRNTTTFYGPDKFAVIYKNEFIMILTGSNFITKRVSRPLIFHRISELDVRLLE